MVSSTVLSDDKRQLTLTLKLPDETKISVEYKQITAVLCSVTTYAEGPTKDKWLRHLGQDLVRIAFREIEVVQEPTPAEQPSPSQKPVLPLIIPL